MFNKDPLHQIVSPVRRELKDFEVHFRQTLRTPNKLLDLIIHYILRRKGKRLRPLLLFLSAFMHNTKADRARMLRSGVLIELIHTATLLHDDVVDNASHRRGLLSIKAIWKSKVAVLVGDFMLAKSLRLALQYRDYEALAMISKVVQQMSEGELLQQSKSRHMLTQESDYFNIIKQKTASLMGACTALGTLSANASQDKQNHMWQLGIRIGQAFQIRDDILDLAPNTLSGKPKGLDIKTKVCTLPLIHALSVTSPMERRRWRKKIQRTSKQNTPNGTQEYLHFYSKQRRHYLCCWTYTKAMSRSYGYAQRLCRKSLQARL